MWWRGCDHFVELSSNGCFYQLDTKLLWWARVRKLSHEGREMGQNWVSPLSLFCGIRSRNFPGNGSFFCQLQLVVWQRSFPTEQRHPPRSLPFSHFLTLESFLQFKKTRKKDIQKPAFFFLPFLPNSAGLILLFVFLLGYLLSGFMDAGGAFTCQDCVYPEQTSSIYSTHHNEQRTQITDGA